MKELSLERSDWLGINSNYKETNFFLQETVSLTATNHQVTDYRN